MLLDIDASAGSRARAAAESGVLSVLRALGSFERALLIQDRYGPFHVVAVAPLDGAPAPDILRAALELLQKRHPLLAARIRQTKGQPCFEAIPNAPLPMSLLQRQGDEAWRAILESELSRRIDNDRGPLFRCTYLFEAEGARAEVILALAHPILDAPGCLLLLDELLRFCQQLTDGRTPEVSVLEVQPAADERFPPAFRGAAMARQTVQFLMEQVGKEIRYRWATRGQTVLPMRASSPGHILNMRFSPEFTDRIARRARLERVTLNSLLNAAMVLAVNRHLYDGRAMPMRTVTFATLRPYVIPPLSESTLSPYITMLRYTLMVAPARGLWDLARDLQSQIESSFRRGHKFVAAKTTEQLIGMANRLRAFRLANTAMNYNGPVKLDPVYGGISVLGLHGAISTVGVGPEYAAQVSLFNEELSWDITYTEADMDQALAQRIADEIRSSLDSATSEASSVSRFSSAPAARP